MDEDRQEPREYDIDMFGAFACPDEVFESLEELQYKLEELQCTCDDYAKKNNQWQQIVIDKEKEHNDIVNQLKEEIDKLKKENLRISKERIFRGKSFSVGFITLKRGLCGIAVITDIRSCWNSLEFLKGSCQEILL